MVLLEPDRSPYDLHFRLVNVDVRVSPWFWLVSAIMGWSAMQVGGFPFLLTWVLCVFVSILIHELGHVLVGRWFGSDGHIILYGFGGLAVGSSMLTSRWQRVAVYFAGPAAQFILLGLIYPARMQLSWETPPLLAEAVWDLWQINLFWPLLNLLPVLPLDGGQISREICDWLMPARGIRMALGISVAVAAALAVGTLWYFQGRQMYLALLFGLLAFGSYQALQQTPPTRRWDKPDPWDR